MGELDDIYLMDSSSSVPSSSSAPLSSSSFNLEDLEMQYLSGSSPSMQKKKEKEKEGGKITPKLKRLSQMGRGKVETGRSRKDTIKKGEGGKKKKGEAGGGLAKANSLGSNVFSSSPGMGRGGERSGLDYRTWNEREIAAK